MFLLKVKCESQMSVDIDSKSVETENLVFPHGVWFRFENHTFKPWKRKKTKRYVQFCCQRLTIYDQKQNQSIISFFLHNSYSSFQVW